MKPQDQQQTAHINEQSTQQKSDLQKAAEQINPAQLADNLVVDQQANASQPQALEDKEQTPFIDDSLRTDKE